jgi:hypothetical protein
MKHNYLVPGTMQAPFDNKGLTVLYRDSVKRFSTSVFFHESVSPKPRSIPLGPFRIFSKIPGDIRSSRCTNCVVDTGGKWKKSSIIKVLIILFGPLWEVELTYRYILAFKFTLRSQQPDNVPINLPPVSLIPVANCYLCRWYQWCTLTWEYLREFSKKFKMVLMGYSGAGGKLKQKISWHCPFKATQKMFGRKRKKGMK